MHSFSQLSRRRRTRVTRSSLALLLLAVLPTFGFADAIYRSTGEHGEPVFSDRAGGERVVLRAPAIRVSDPAAVAAQHDAMLDVALTLATERRAEAAARTERLAAQRDAREAAQPQVVERDRYVVPARPFLGGFRNGFYRPHRQGIHRSPPRSGPEPAPEPAQRSRAFGAD